MMSNTKLAIKRTLTFLLAFAMVVTSLYVAPVTAKADEIVEEVVEAAEPAVVEEVSEATQSNAVVNEEVVEETIVEENTQIEADVFAQTSNEEYYTAEDFYLEYESGKGYVQMKRNDDAAKTLGALKKAINTTGEGDSKGIKFYVFDDVNNTDGIYDAEHGTQKNDIFVNKATTNSGEFCGTEYIYTITKIAGTDVSEMTDAEMGDVLFDLGVSKDESETFDVEIKIEKVTTDLDIVTSREDVTNLAKGITGGKLKVYIEPEQYQLDYDEAAQMKKVVSVAKAGVMSTAVTAAIMGSTDVSINIMDDGTSGWSELAKDKRDGANTGGHVDFSLKYAIVNDEKYLETPADGGVTMANALDRLNIGGEAIVGFKAVPYGKASGTITGEFRIKVVAAGNAIEIVKETIPTESIKIKRAASGTGMAMAVLSKLGYYDEDGDGTASGEDNVGKVEGGAWKTWPDGLRIQKYSDNAGDLALRDPIIATAKKTPSKTNLGAALKNSDPSYDLSIVSVGGLDTSTNEAAANAALYALMPSSTPVPVVVKVEEKVCDDASNNTWSGEADAEAVACATVNVVVEEATTGKQITAELPTSAVEVPFVKAETDGSDNGPALLNAIKDVIYVYEGGTAVASNKVKMVNGTLAENDYVVSIDEIGGSTMTNTSPTANLGAVEAGMAGNGGLAAKSGTNEEIVVKIEVKKIDGSSAYKEPENGYIGTMKIKLVPAVTGIGLNGRVHLYNADSEGKALIEPIVVYEGQKDMNVYIAGKIIEGLAGKAKIVKSSEVGGKTVYAEKTLKNLVAELPEKAEPNTTYYLLGVTGSLSDAKKLGKKVEGTITIEAYTSSADGSAFGSETTVTIDTEPATTTNKQVIRLLPKTGYVASAEFDSTIHLGLEADPLETKKKLEEEIKKHLVIYAWEEGQKVLVNSNDVYILDSNSKAENAVPVTEATGWSSEAMKYVVTLNTVCSALTASTTTNGAETQLIATNAAGEDTAQRLVVSVKSAQCPKTEGAAEAVDNTGVTVTKNVLYLHKGYKMIVDGVTDNPKKDSKTITVIKGTDIKDVEKQLGISIVKYDDCDVKADGTHNFVTNASEAYNYGTIATAEWSDDGTAFAKGTLNKGEARFLMTYSALGTKTTGTGANKVVTLDTPGVYDVTITAKAYYGGDDGTTTDGTTAVALITNGKGEININVVEASHLSTVKVSGSDNYYTFPASTKDTVETALRKKLEGKVTAYEMTESGGETEVAGLITKKEYDEAKKGADFDATATYYYWDIKGTWTAGAAVADLTPQITVTKAYVDEKGVAKTETLDSIEGDWKVTIGKKDGSISNGTGLNTLWGAGKKVAVNKTAGSGMLDQLKKSIAKRGIYASIGGVEELYELAEKPKTISGDDIHFVYTITRLGKASTDADMEKLLESTTWNNSKKANEIDLRIKVESVKNEDGTVKTIQALDLTETVSVVRGDNYTVILNVYRDLSKTLPVATAEGEIVAGKVIGDLSGSAVESYASSSDVTWYNADTGKVWNLYSDPVNDDLTLNAYIRNCEGNDDYYGFADNIIYNGKAYKPKAEVYSQKNGALIKASTYKLIYLATDEKGNKIESTKSITPKNAGLYYVRVIDKKSKATLIDIPFEIEKAEIVTRSTVNGVTTTYLPNKAVVLAKSTKALAAVKSIKTPSGAKASYGAAKDYTYEVKDRVTGAKTTNVAVDANGKFLCAAAGHYSVVVKANANGNFTGETASFNLDVTTKEYSVSSAKISYPNGKSVIYNGENNRLAFTVEMPVAGEQTEGYKVFTYDPEVRELQAINADGDAVPANIRVAFTTSKGSWDLKPGKVVVTLSAEEGSDYYGQKTFAYTIKKDPSKVLKKSMLQDVAGLSLKTLNKTGVDYDGREWTIEDLMKSANKDVTDDEIVKAIDSAVAGATYMKDFKVSYTKNINAGKATLTVEPVDGSGWSGTIKQSFKINKVNLSKVADYSEEDGTGRMLYDTAMLSNPAAHVAADDGVWVIKGSGKNVKYELAMNGKNGAVYDAKYVDPSYPDETGRMIVVDGGYITASYKENKLSSTKPITITIKGKKNYTGSKTLTISRTTATSSASK